MSGHAGDGEAPFSFRATRDGEVTIRCRGRPATVLRGNAAARFLTRVDALDDAGVQLEMAKATGDFKRGNERLGKGKEGRKGP